jgi:hypothetical protein
LCDDSSQNQSQERHEITRLGREILGYILDVTVLYLDGSESRYEVTLENVATYAGKSPRQIMACLDRLICDGYLESYPPASNHHLAAHAMLYPTVETMKSIPAFAEMDESMLQTEVHSLREGRLR